MNECMYVFGEVRKGLHVHIYTGISKVHTYTNV